MSVDMARKASLQKMTSKKAKRNPKKKVSLSIDTIELKSIRLLESNSSLNLFVGDVPELYKTSVAISVGGRPEDKTILVNIRSENTNQKNESVPEDRRSSVVINVIFQCVYDSKVEFVSEELSDTPFSNQIAATSLLAAGPFIRQHVHQISTSMGIPSLTLPLYRGTRQPVLKRKK